VEPESAAAKIDRHVSRRQHRDRVAKRRVVVIVVKAIVEDPMLGVEALAGELAVLRVGAHHPSH
jgi:hypothetical protein